MIPSRSYRKAILLISLLAVVIGVVGCKKVVVTPPPTPQPPPPPPARPTVTLQASSTFIQKGETVTRSVGGRPAQRDRLALLNEGGGSLQRHRRARRRWRGWRGRGGEGRAFFSASPQPQKPG